MSKYYRYAAIFETTVLDGVYQKVIVDPLKIELLPNLPREYTIPEFGPPVVPRGQDVLLAVNGTLPLRDPHKYVVITARTTEQHPATARRLCEDVVDRGVTGLSVLFGTALFARLVYRGWITEGDNFMVEAQFRTSPRQAVPSVSLETDLSAMARHVRKDADTEQRYKLMSRFFSKAALESISEEHFLYLWTVLEIFPMKGTAKVNRIGEFLSSVVGRDAAEVKQALDIGRLYGARSKLVHDGRFPSDQQGLARAIDKLETICTEVLRAMSGQPYSEALERYFQS